MEILIQSGALDNQAEVKLTNMAEPASAVTLLYENGNLHTAVLQIQMVSSRKGSCD